MHRPWCPGDAHPPEFQRHRRLVIRDKLSPLQGGRSTPFSSPSTMVHGACASPPTDYRAGAWTQIAGPKKSIGPRSLSCLLCCCTDTGKARRTGEHPPARAWRLPMHFLARRLDFRCRRNGNPFLKPSSAFHLEMVGRPCGRATSSTSKTCGGFC